MKTIDEAASEYSCRKDNEFESYSGFKSGVEFAQRWIPVEENEVPPDDTDDIFNLTHGYSQRVLVKEKGVIYFGFYSKFSASWIVPGRSGNIQVTHWRPIELK